jgi:hypothetical protein
MAVFPLITLCYKPPLDRKASTTLYGDKVARCLSTSYIEQNVPTISNFELLASSTGAISFFGTPKTADEFRESATTSNRKQDPDPDIPNKPA